MREYFVGILLPEEVKKTLNPIINTLSVRHKSPVFEPHLTLVPDVRGEDDEIIKRTEKLASEISPFTVELGEISFSTTHFQCVFVRVKSNSKLMEANLKTEEIFNVEHKVYMPHISLMYSDISMAERERVCSEIEIPAKLSFIAEKLALVPYAKSPSDWVHLAEFKLGSKKLDGFTE